MRTAWLLWIGAAGLLLVTAPALVRMAGGVKQYLYRLFVLTLPLEVNYYVTFRPDIKAAGYTGFQLNPTLLVALPLLVLILLDQRPGSGRAPRLPRTGFISVTIFVLTAALSVVNTTSKGWTFFGFLEISYMLVFAVVAAHFCSTKEGLTATRRMLMLGLLVQCCLLLWQHATRVDFTLAGGSLTARGMGSRFSGTLTTPSASATFLVVTLLFAIGGLMSRLQTHARRWAWGLVGLGLVCLLLSRTRAAWGAFALGVLVLGIQKPVRRQLRLGAVLALATVLLVAAGIQWSVIQQRLGDQATDDWTTRWNLNLIAWEMIKAHPFAGVGLNNATQVVYDYAASAPLVLNEWGTAWVFVPHNQFLLVASETGVPGLLAFLAVLLSATAAARRAARSADVTVNTTGAVLAACFIGMVWALNLDFINGAQTYVLLWFLIGAAHGARQCARLVAQPEALHPAQPQRRVGMRYLPRGVAATVETRREAPLWTARARAAATQPGRLIQVGSAGPTRRLW